ncbi:mitochondrial inner membrane protein OXA1L-like, partial [Alligator sinensis]|uniref:Mitochondrial inner membrane protein OXA1L-like n=1 Tax=Alligator sinensis TaxID=38654 RepID=A0A1U7SSF6_ALLSI
HTRVKVHTCTPQRCQGSKFSARDLPLTSPAPQTHSSTIPPARLHGRTQRGTPLPRGCRAQSTAAASAPVLPAASPLLPEPRAELAVPGPGPGPGLELSLSELGLGNYTPVGLIQTVLESLHVHLGLPWWGAIMAATAVARFLVFPLILKGQREETKLNNQLPEITRFTTLLSEARRSGNHLQFAKVNSDLMRYQQANYINPLAIFLGPFVQAPVFISFFIALREMTILPVPSMQSGGLAWFPDLTAPDPFYILPLTVTGSSLLMVQLGAESGVDIPHLKIIKTVFRVIPLVILPLTITFPTAMITYWLTSNVLALVQVGLLRIPAVRTRLHIPERVKHKRELFPNNEGFFQNLTDEWKNIWIRWHMEEVCLKQMAEEELPGAGSERTPAPDIHPQSCEAPKRPD